MGRQGQGRTPGAGTGARTPVAHRPGEDLGSPAHGILGHPHRLLPGRLGADPHRRPSTARGTRRGGGHGRHPGHQPPARGPGLDAPAGRPARHHHRGRPAHSARRYPDDQGPRRRRPGPDFRAAAAHQAAGGKGPRRGCGGLPGPRPRARLRDRLRNHPHCRGRHDSPQGQNRLLHQLEWGGRERSGIAGRAWAPRFPSTSA